jgi:membrane-bound serine protease (ClpP class)
MSKGRALAVLLAAFVLLGAGLVGDAAGAPASRPQVLELKLSGVVDPFMASYVERGVATAKADGDAAVLLVIDTPGGLDSSMRHIVQAILASKVPVICYTAPSGARAASAGTFIMLSCPINAMAPGTNIGAAHPVGVSGIVENEKVTNDAAAFIRSLADRWGRNAAWAEQAVRSAVSVSSEEALKIKVVDYTALSTAGLLQQVTACAQRSGPVGGPATACPTSGSRGAVNLDGAQVIPFGMSLSESLFHAFADPNIAFLLLNIGFLALILWVFHPGVHVSLAVGVISMVLGLAILETLPVRLTGVLLLLVAAILFVLDVKAKAHGVLTAGGIAVLVLGGLLLFNPTVPSAHVSRPLIIIVAVAAGLFASFTLRALLSAKRAPVRTGLEALEGSTGVALRDLDPRGTVRARSETWTAESMGGTIPAGTAVRIVRVKGVKLLVEPELGQAEPTMSPAGTARGGAKEGEAE